MDFRRFETARPQSSSSFGRDTTPSFVQHRRLSTRPSSFYSHCRFVSRRPRSSADICRDERRYSTPPKTLSTPPRRLRRSSAARPTSFLDLSEPSRFTMPGARLFSSTSTERKMSLEVKIPDGLSSYESLRPLAISKSGSVGRTLNTFLRPKRKSLDAVPLSSPPGLFSGESLHSDSSPPSTPYTSSIAADESFLDLDAVEIDKELKAMALQAYLEQQELLQGRNQFEYRMQLIPHHKYPKEEVPYMQSYSHVSLHNDYYANELLHYLTPPGSPSFYDFGCNPPRDVLDLGCGEGYWAAEAASVWKTTGTVVTAFDIVDLGRPLRKTLDSEIAQRIIWVKGNFLKQSLPFPPKSFDLVRMANLTLAIPKARWSSLLKEVKRVLKPGGIVEIVDDELFFPSVQPGPVAPPKRAESLSALGKPKLESLIHDEPATGRSKPLPPLPTPCRFPLNNKRPSPKRTVRPSPAEQYRQRATATRTMETVFQKMLQFEYSLAPRPHEFLENEILKVFDSASVETKEVTVPKKDLTMSNSKTDDVVSRPPDGNIKPRKHHLRHSLEGGVVTDFTRPAFVPSKAAQLLELQAGSSGPYQPSGFMISPTTLIPCEPDVLEMHACRNIHVLLSCKDAICRFIGAQRAEDGTPLISEDEFEDLVFDYENFKRRRMNWPQDFPGVDFEEGSASPTMQAKPLFGRKDLATRTRAQSMNTLTSVSVMKDQVIPIRRIRAFMGRKSDSKAPHKR